ncbi:zinc finger protein 768-like [Osmerus mordax]|uniref:zinc finger protein 768-like n=1 Tax=Osmerus mordax TaxID=8014 RepID=UPI00350E9C4E
MTNSMAFHTQIASIMEVLANAAVAEICKLVDEDYAVIRLEMSHSQRENRALKRKLQTLELKMARERAERTMRERVLANRPGVSVRLLDKFRAAAVSRGGGNLSGHLRNVGKPERQGSWRIREQSAAANEGPDSSTQDVITVRILEESADAEASASSSNQSQIKQEMTDRCPTPSPPLPPGSDRLTHLFDSDDAGAEECPVKLERKDEEQEAEDTFSHEGDDMDLRKTVDGDRTLETSTRAWTSHHQDLVHYYHETDPGQGPDLEQTGQCLRPTENSHWTAGPVLSHPGPALGMSNTWGQRRQGAGVCLGAGARPGSGVGPGSLGSESQSGSGAIYGLQIGPDPGQHPYLPPPHGVRPDQKHQRSPAFNTFFQPNTMHTTTTSVVSRTNHNTGPMAPSSLPLHAERMEGRGKTDRERPYSCPTCGKRFAEAGYVKKHQTVHTKEKPFRCKQCWKSFSFLSNLIRHRGVHSAQDQAGDLTGVHGGANASI